MTAVPAAAAAAPRLAVNAAPTAAPVLQEKKKKLIQVKLFKNTDLSRFSPTPKFNLEKKF
jgi:hypothetical protein